jgi:hypothetical protein
MKDIIRIVSRGGAHNIGFEFNVAGGTVTDFAVEMIANYLAKPFMRLGTKLIRGDTTHAAIIELVRRLRLRPFGLKSYIELETGIRILECKGVGHCLYDLAWTHMAVPYEIVDHIYSPRTDDDAHKKRWCVVRFEYKGKAFFGRKVTLFVNAHVKHAIKFPERVERLKVCTCGFDVMFADLQIDFVYTRRFLYQQTILRFTDCSIGAADITGLVNLEAFPRLTGTASGPLVSYDMFSVNATVNAAIDFLQGTHDLVSFQQYFMDHRNIGVLLYVHLFIGLKKALERSLPPELALLILEKAGYFSIDLNTQLHTIKIQAVFNLLLLDRPQSYPIESALKFRLHPMLYVGSVQKPGMLCARTFKIVKQNVMKLAQRVRQRVSNPPDAKRHRSAQ